MEYVITFENTNYVIKAEDILLTAGIAVKVMPLPGQIRAGCGLCLRVSSEDVKRSVGYFSQNEIGQIEVYEKQEQGGRMSFQPAAL